LNDPRNPTRRYRGGPTTFHLYGTRGCNRWNQWQIGVARKPRKTSQKPLPSLATICRAFGSLGGRLTVRTNRSTTTRASVRRLRALDVSRLFVKQTTRRGHKTDTSETTRATSRDASPASGSARFAGRTVSRVVACVRVCRPGTSMVRRGSTVRVRQRLFSDKEPPANGRFFVVATDTVEHLPTTEGLDGAIGHRSGFRTAAISGSAGAWAMSLTGAELRLLPYLGTHLSFPEIATRLFISRNTVKTEAVSIYRKTGRLLAQPGDRTRCRGRPPGKQSLPTSGKSHPGGMTRRQRTAGQM